MFAKIPYKNTWYELDIDNLKLYNVNGGWHPIDENSREWIEAEIYSYDSWHHLYRATGYNPLITDYTNYVRWIDPKGKCYYCSDSHLITAEKILDIVFGIEDDNIINADDILYEKGWIKVTTSQMYYYYAEDGMYAHMTPAQEETFHKWREHHHMPHIELPSYVN